MLGSHGFLGWKQVSSFLSTWFIHAVRFYSSSGAAEKCFSVNKCPFKDQGYCLGMSKSVSEQYFRWNQKQNQKHIFDWIRGLAELFLQTHHFPSLPLLPGANLIISSLLLLHFNKQALFPSVHFSLLYFWSPFLFTSFFLSLQSSSLYRQTVYLVFYCPNKELSCFFSFRLCFKNSSKIIQSWTERQSEAVAFAQREGSR